MQLSHDYLSKGTISAKKMLIFCKKSADISKIKWALVLTFLA